jgi:hypothetical protein
MSLSESGVKKRSRLRLGLQDRTCTFTGSSGEKGGSLLYSGPWPVCVRPALMDVKLALGFCA